MISLCSLIAQWKLRDPPTFSELCAEVEEVRRQALADEGNCIARYYEMRGVPP